METLNPNTNGAPTTTDERPTDYSDIAAAAFANAPWSVVPEDNTLPEQFYNFKVIESYPSDDGNEDPNLRRARWALVLEITAPEEHIGRIKNENFYVGTDKDPHAADAITWKTSQGAINLKSFCSFVGAGTFDAPKPFELLNKEFGAFINTSQSPDKTRKYSNVSWFKLFKVGEVTPGTPTEKRPPSRFRSSKAQVTAAAVNPDAEIPCPKCQQMIRQSAMLDHLRSQACVATPPSVNV